MAGYKSKLIFAVLANILHDKSMTTYEAHVGNETEWPTVSRFILLRYLSMSYSPAVRQLIIDNYIALQRMPEKPLYRWLLQKVPKQPSGFIKYIK